MRRPIWICSVLVAAAAAVGVVGVSALGSSGGDAAMGPGERSSSATSASGQVGQDPRTILHDTFPAAVDTPIDNSLRTDGTIVAQARLTGSDGSEWLLAVTDKQTICASTEQTTTCQPEAAVRTAGIFFAAIDCSSKAVQVVGLTPAGVTSVAARGPQPVQARPSDEGIVRMALTNSVDGLSLSNGAMNPMKLDLEAICSPHSL